MRQQREKNRRFKSIELLIQFRFMLYALCLMLVFFCGCATTETGEIKESLELQDLPAISGVDIQYHAVFIAINKPFIYTIYKSDDPYKIFIELPNVNIGDFKNRIVSEMPGTTGITEVIPSQIESPYFMAKIEILLQSPSTFETEYKDNNVLMVKVKEELLPEKVIEEVLPKEEAAAVEVLPKETVEEKLLPEEKPKEEVIPKATEISSVTLEKSAEAVNVLIKGNGSMYPNVFPLNGRIVIDIPNVAMKAKLPSAVISPVKGIRYGKHDDKIRLVLDLKEKTDFNVAAINDSIVVTLQSPQVIPPEAIPPPVIPVEKAEAVKEEEVTVAKEPEVEKKPEAVAAIKAHEVSVAGKYTGKRLSLDFQDADIVPIFRLLADISGYNIVVSPEVRGRLTMKLINVPWDQALDLILKTFGLGKSLEGNIIRIAPHDVFTKEREEAAKAMEAGMKAEPLETRVLPVSYANIEVIEASVKKIITPRGNVTIDKRTSSMIVKDIPSAFFEIDRLLANLDKPTSQVLIEARIVEVSTNSLKDLGIQWGLEWNPTSGLMSAGGSSSLGTGSFTGNNFLVDFPSGASGAGSGSGFSFGILNPSRTFGLDLQLSALQKIGKSRMVSNPKILTLDNVTAKLMQGEEIPYPQVTGEGNVSAAFKPVAISIEVTPHVTPDNSVIMNIVTTKEDFSEFVQIGSGYAPRTTKVEGKTNVLVGDGETLVIGGVYKKKETEASSGVPFLMDIPLIGWLFKNKNVSEDISELLIFITPRIVPKS
ncbi:MAG: type IV pilus secretin PilQ [Nitrospirota bacterium]